MAFHEIEELTPNGRRNLFYSICKYNYSVDYICIRKLTRVSYWSRWVSINCHGIIHQILPTKLCYQVQQLWCVCAKLGICLHADTKHGKLLTHSVVAHIRRSLTMLWCKLFTHFFNFCHKSVTQWKLFGTNLPLKKDFLPQTCHWLTVLWQRSVTHWQCFGKNLSFIDNALHRSVTHWQACHALTRFWPKPVRALAELGPSLAMFCTHWQYFGGSLSLIDKALAQQCHAKEQSWSCSRLLHSPWPCMPFLKAVFGVCLQFSWSFGTPQPSMLCWQHAIRCVILPWTMRQHYFCDYWVYDLILILMSQQKWPCAWFKQWYDGPASHFCQVPTRCAWTLVLWANMQ